MPHPNVPDRALRQAFVELERMHAGNTKHGVDAIHLEKGDGRLPTCLISAHDRLPLVCGNVPVYGASGNI
jgi:hypothetical protein